MTTFHQMKKELRKYGIPEQVCNNLADTKMAAILGRPVLDIFEFDTFLHSQYGDYEKEGKSMQDIFVDLFGEQANKFAYYFGVPTEEPQNE